MRRGRERLHARLKAEHEAANPGTPFHADAPPPPLTPTPVTETAR